MSERKHTPGPWTIDEYGIRCNHKHNYGIVAQARDGRMYSEYTRDSATLEIDNEADAWLIVAAPDMLALLRDIAKADEAYIDALTGMGIPVSEPLPMAERINALIAKAEGR